MKMMKWILLTLAATLGTSCVRINCSYSIDKTYNISSFNAIDVSYAFEVELVPSDVESVRLQIPADAEKYVVVEKKGNTLYIGMKKGHTYNFVKHGNDSYLKAYVSFKEMYGITASGASEIDMKGAYAVPTQNIKIDLSGASSFEGDVLEANRLTANLSGASSFEGEQFTVNTIKLDLSGASELEIKGSGNDMELTCSGASEVDAYDFPVKTFSGSLSGASEAYLYVTETFSGDASGASHFTVKGNPRVIKADESGASSYTFK